MGRRESIATPPLRADAPTSFDRDELARMQAEVQSLLQEARALLEEARALSAFSPVDARELARRGALSCQATRCTFRALDRLRAACEESGVLPR